MRHSTKVIALTAGLVFAFTACENHQAKIDALQKEHDRLSQQYQRDCGSEYLKAKPEFSQKCIDEAKEMDDAMKKLQLEQAKH